MNSLPVCNNPMTSQELIRIVGRQLIFTIHENNKVNKLITDLVGSDCWALTNTILNEDLDKPTEIVFNSYEENKLSLKEIIMNNSIRNNIIENPHDNLLLPLYRFKRSANIEIYMFPVNFYKIQINYNHKDEVFTVSGFMSDAYVNTYILTNFFSF